MDRIATALEIKAVRFPERVISGYAAVHSNEDRVGDVIDPGAFTKTLSEQAPSDVAVLIGHNLTMLPVGIPQIIRVDSKGLYTETLVKPGPVGDDLLETAQFLHTHGKTLGMSIGYRVRSSKPERKAAGGYVKRLMDIDLREYSFATAATIANPDALTVGVKTTDGEESDETKAAVGSFSWTSQRVQAALREKNQSGCYIVEIFPNRAIYRTYSGDDVEQLYQVSYSVSGDSVTIGDPTPVDVQYVPMSMPSKTGNPDPSIETKAGGTMPTINDLPNSAFLFVEPGEDDEQGRRVPFTKRHFPYRDQEGKLAPSLLETAVIEIPESKIAGLAPAPLVARVRRMLDQARGVSTKTLDLDRPEWTVGVALEVSGLGDALRSIAEDIAEEQAAQRRLGEDTKQYRRIRADTRGRIAEVIEQLHKQLDWATTLEAGAEERAVIDRYERELALLEV